MKILQNEVSHCTVMGFGLTGRAVVTFLLARGCTPFVSDAAALSESGRSFLEAHAVSYEEGGHSETRLLATDAIVLSPGVDPTLPELEKARSRNILVLSELDLAFLFCPRVPIIAVTGTNGKGTTVKLIECALRESGVKPIVAGNIGIPAISIVDRVHADQVLVLEVSSFQLEQSLLFHPKIAVLLNLTADHLDRHKTMDAYREAKGRLFQNLTDEDIAILTKHLSDDYPQIKARRLFFDDYALPSRFAGEDVAPHNRLNLKAAFCVCSALSPTFFPSVLKMEDLHEAFSLPFCLNPIGFVDGCAVINDSKSTNAASTLAALQSFDGPMVLILGGRHKRSGYAELSEAIRARNVRKTILYGEASAFLRASLERVGYSELTVCVTLEEAVDAALRACQSGDLLLFSPSCSSHDQYDNYLQRGAVFSQIIRSNPSFSPQK